MKLIHRSLLYFSAALFVVIGVWAVLFYANMIDEIQDSLDDGLENNKEQLLERFKVEKNLLNEKEFRGINFAVQEVDKTLYFNNPKEDVYIDTLMYFLNEDDLEPVRMLLTHFQQDNTYYQLRIVTSQIEEDDLIEDTLYAIVWLFVSLVVSLVLLNFFVLRKLWQPFYKILRHLTNFRIDKNTEMITIDSKTKEFSELQSAANALLKRSVQIYTSQKEFTENASHELQTPLAIILNKLELLLDSEELSNEEKSKRIYEIVGIAERMKRLNKSLLLLAKIENNHYTNTQKIDLNEEIERVVAEFAEIADFRKITIEMRLPEQCEVQMDKVLANILLTNLVKNAIVYNIPNGKVIVTVEGSTLKICNTGREKALNNQKIFERFYKKGVGSQSTGLGLSIVNAICTLYKIHPQYQYLDKKHCFILKF